jgi:hypothetical protein
LRHVADQLRPKWPKLAALIDDSKTDVLSHLDFPEQHRRKLRSPLERLNKEVKRRGDVVGIFPNEASIGRRQLRRAFVLPHPRMLPSGSSIASPECSRRHVSLSIRLRGLRRLLGVTQTGFPVRSASLLSRPDLAPPEPRRATEGMGGAEPPGATRSALFRASMARMASTGPSPK